MKRIDSANTLASYCIQRLRGVGILHTAKASRLGCVPSRRAFLLFGPAETARQRAGRCYSWAMSKAIRDTDEVAELKQLYDRLALAVERAAATIHIRGADSTAFSTEDTKCVALWDRIRALMQKDR